MNRPARGALAGAAAALIWRATDPLSTRLFGTDYSDGRLATRASRAGLVGGTLVHVAGGAAFGWAFARLGGRGPRAGMAAALAENALLWPALLVFAPEWARDPRALANATAGHALFGGLLGTFLDALDRRALAD
jgi:hypothetical protein